MKLFCVIAFTSMLFGSFPPTYPQNSAPRNWGAKDVRIRKTRPHLFIEFVKKGRGSLYEGEKEERVWLRLANNSIWPILICSGSVPSKYGDLELAYEVDHIEGTAEKPSTRHSDNCQNSIIKAGTTVIFSVPQTHVLPTLLLKVSYRYAWEKDPDGTENILEPRHFIYFYGSDLPNKG